MPLAITIPEGWSGCGLWVKGYVQGTGNGMMVAFWTVDEVPTDPCHRSAVPSVAALGSTVEEMATALAAQAITETTPPTEVTLDGYAGLRLGISVPPDIDVSDCDAGEFWFWDGVGGSAWWIPAIDAPGLVGEVWIVDVDGARVVLTTHYLPETTLQLRDELELIVRSVDFNP